MHCQRGAILLSSFICLSTHIQFDFDPFPFTLVHLIYRAMQPASDRPSKKTHPRVLSYLLQLHHILPCHDPFLLNSRLINILNISSFMLSQYLSVLRIQRLKFFFKTFTQHCHHTISNFLKEKKKKKRATLSSTHNAVKFPRYGKDQNEIYRKALFCELPVKSNTN